MAEMTVSAAAAELGVTERQVTRLARAGALPITCEIGKSILLDAASVLRMAHTTRHRSRPWNGNVAWAALALLSARPVNWISPPHITRLKHRLRRSSPSEVAFLARRRAHTRRMQGWGDDANTLVTGGSITATGPSALAHVPGTAARFGLSPVVRDTVDGYITDDRVNDVIDTFGLIPEHEGHITLRVVTDLNPFFTSTTLPIAAVAVDLMESLDTRERSAGTRVLQELLDDIG
jgi:hypothetical protein